MEDGPVTVRFVIISFLFLISLVALSVVSLGHTDEFTHMANNTVDNIQDVLSNEPEPLHPAITQAMDYIDAKKPHLSDSCLLGAARILANMYEGIDDELDSSGECIHTVVMQLHKEFRPHANHTAQNKS